MTDRYTLHHGDCREVMATMDADSVDSIVCDPPYALTANKKGGSGAASLNVNSPAGRSRIGTGNPSGGFMGKSWDAEIPGVDVWQAAIRVAKPGAHLLAFGGTRTFHRLACAIEDAGWEIRDCVMWVYSQGFPKSLNLDGDWQGWGTALKPAWEPVIVARKPLAGTVAENVQRYGCGAINVDVCRIGTEPVVSTKGLGQNSRLNDDNWKGIGQKPSPTVSIGRWPANLAHDGSDEVVGLFPQSVSTGGNGEASRQYKSDGRTLSGTCASTGGFGDSGSAARFFYCAKASRSDRGDYNKHPTVKPTALMRWLCRLVTRPDGLILDPFMGSGSTGKAAILEGFRFVGIELEEASYETARQRIEEAEEELSEELGMFNETRSPAVEVPAAATLPDDSRRGVQTCEVTQ